MKSILWPFCTGGLKETHTTKQYHQDHTRGSYKMCTQLAMSLDVKYKTPVTGGIGVTVRTLGDLGEIRTSYWDPEVWKGIQP